MNPLWSPLLEAEIERFGLKKLTQAYLELQSHYRGKRNSSPTLSDVQVVSYLLTRLPATYAVVAALLSRYAHVLHGVKTLLDIGAGPGTATWAALECLNLESYTQIEKEMQMRLWSRRLAPENCIKGQFTLGDFRQVALPAHDLAIGAYCLNEVTLEEQLQVFTQLQSQKALLLIEPGTPEGFSHIARARAHFLNLGWHVIGPCPHGNTCPLYNTEDWCHFSQRLNRPVFLRQLKTAELSYEDEKYSYVLLSQTPLETFSGSRIIRHPQKRKGHIHLTLCTPDGVENQTVSKKHPQYKAVKKAKWGDVFIT